MRKKGFRILLSILISLCLVAVSFGQEEMMSNNEVVSLTKAGLSSSLIIDKIRISKTNFDLSTDSLIKLKQSGVTDDIVSAMLAAKTEVSANTGFTPGKNSGDPNDPMASHSYGIYLYEEKNGVRKMNQLSPNVSAQNRTGGMITSQITYGIGKVKIKANLPGRNAYRQIQTPNPVFYFYLDVESGGLNTSSGIPSSPREFSLVRFHQRSNNREVTIGKTNVFGSKGGLSGEYIVQFNAEDLGNGIFKVTPASLTNGEYAFYLVNSGDSNAGTAVGSKFFDFGVVVVP